MCLGSLASCRTGINEFPCTEVCERRHPAVVRVRRNEPNAVNEYCSCRRYATDLRALSLVEAAGVAVYWELVTYP